MLTLAPIIGVLLFDYGMPRDIMIHIECWLLLVDILGLLTCGGHAGGGVHGPAREVDRQAPPPKHAAFSGDQAQVAPHAAPA